MFPMYYNGCNEFNDVVRLDQVRIFLPKKYRRAHPRFVLEDV